MIKFTVKTDLSGFHAKMAMLRNQVPFATALALTNTAKGVANEDLPASMSSAFKSAVPFTMRAISWRKATKANLLAEVYIKPKQAAYLRTEIAGGPRAPAIEKFLAGILPAGMFVVPTKFTKTTSSGKVSLAWLRKIVQQLSGGGIVAKKRRRSSAPVPFVIKSTSEGMHPGIWVRQGQQAVPLLLFVSQPKYSRRWDFYAISERGVRARFPLEFQKALRQALASAR